jgi:hypothetical protein
MQRTSIVKCLVGSVGVSALAALIGCAVGTDPGVGASELATLPIEAGTGDENSVVLPPSNRAADEVDAATDEDAGTEVDSGAGGADAAADAGPDSGGGGGGGPTCVSPNACAGATDLGSLDSDQGSGTKTAGGSGSQWFTIRANEGDSSVFGAKMNFKAELTSPPGTNFDLFMYVAGGSSGQECSAVTASSTNASGLDTAHYGWGEGGTLSNGSDDSRTVTIEVRWVSGSCSAANKWSLIVRGNSS